MSANLHKRRFIQSGGTIELPSAIAWPNSPQEAVGGALKAAWERYDGNVSHDATGGKHARYIVQRDRYRALIDGATPDGDMGELAAALAGLPVVERALRELARHIDAHEKDVRVSRDALLVVQDRVRQVRVWWESGGVSYEQATELAARGEHPLSNYDELRAEIYRLLGV